MKLVRAGARPISGDTGLRDIEALVEAGTERCPDGPAETVRWPHREDYVRHLLSYLADRALPPLKIVVNAGNGTAGLVIDALAPHLPVEFIRVHHEPDSAFPNGIPNPLLPENRAATASRGTAISIAASCSTRAATSSRATTSSACWPRPCSRRSRAPGSSTIRA